MKLLAGAAVALPRGFRTLHAVPWVFGALHLVCYPPQCAGDAGHAAEHHSAAGRWATRTSIPRVIMRRAPSISPWSSSASSACS